MHTMAQRALVTVRGTLARTSRAAAAVAAQPAAALPRRSASSSSAASRAANGASTPTVAPSPASSLPGPTLSYLTSADVARLSASDAPQAVSVFLTCEALSGALASAGAGRDIPLSSLLGGSCSLFAGARDIPAASLVDFTAKSGDSLWCYPTPAAGPDAAPRSYPRVLLVGMGPAAEVKMGSYRSASWRAISACQALLLTRVALMLPSPPLSLAQPFFDVHESNDIVANVCRVALLSEHYFRRYLSDSQRDQKKKRAMQSISLIDLEPPKLAAGKSGNGKKASAAASASIAPAPPSHDSVVRTNALVARATLRAREWANERGDVATPEWMENEARSVARDAKLKFSVLHEADLEKEGLHLLRAVGQGAAPNNRARLVLLEYRGAGENEPFTALVGKGICFDTGGLLIKGRGNMEGMHIDMGGAAAVLGAMSVLPALGIRANVVAALALAENSIDANSYKPLAILPSAKGTVEVQDTDAEGRLALADAFTFVQRTWSPKRMVDLATLTGASVVALGETTAALFANDDALAAALSSASQTCGEQTWRMPILPEHADELKSAHADFRNVSPSRQGGACVAAAFLQKFVESGVAWAHVDIAGPAMLSKSREWQPEGGTGFGAQLLLSWLLAAHPSPALAPAVDLLQPENAQQVKESLKKWAAQQ